jgi:hypothetical protein
MRQLVAVAGFCNLGLSRQVTSNVTSFYRATQTGSIAAGEIRVSQRQNVEDVYQILFRLVQLKVRSITAWMYMTQYEQLE